MLLHYGCVPKIASKFGWDRDSALMPAIVLASEGQQHFRSDRSASNHYVLHLFRRPARREREVGVG